MATRKRNEYIIMGDYAVIYIKKKDKVYECFVDIEDFDKVKDYSWHLGIRDKIICYAERTQYLGIINGKPKYKTVLMHSMIMDCFDTPYKIVVDHKNHNTLDNRKSNLRVIEYQNNTKHRSGKNSNNTSGYRNVSKVGNWWYVQMQVDGKNTMLKKFPPDQLEEA